MKIVLASSNPGKLREIQQVLTPLTLQLVPQSEFVTQEAEETGLTFVENAIIKARHAARLSGLPALADDSGLEVDALQGAPGIYSARYAGPGATDQENNSKLLRELEKLPQAPRSARFHCVLAYLRHTEDPCPLIAQGVWEGEIIDDPRGDNGFGYDPLFFSREHRATSAELPSEVKNRSSHRAKALEKLTALLKDAADL